MRHSRSRSNIARTLTVQWTRHIPAIVYHSEASLANCNYQSRFDGRQSRELCPKYSCMAHQACIARWFGSKSSSRECSSSVVSHNAIWLMNSFADVPKLPLLPRISTAPARLLMYIPLLSFWLICTPALPCLESGSLLERHL